MYNGKLLDINITRFFSNVWNERPIRERDIERCLNFMYDNDETVYSEFLSTKHTFYDTLPLGDDNPSKISVEIKDALYCISNLKDFKELQLRNETFNEFFRLCLDYYKKIEYSQNQKMCALLLLVINIWERAQSQYKTYRFLKMR